MHIELCIILKELLLKIKKQSNLNIKTKSFSMYFRGDKNVFRVIPLAPQVLGALRIAGINLKLMLQNGPFCLTFSNILYVIDFSCKAFVRFKVELDGNKYMAK